MISHQKRDASRTVRCFEIGRFDKKTPSQQPQNISFCQLFLSPHNLAWTCMGHDEFFGKPQDRNLSPRPPGS